MQFEIPPHGQLSLEARSDDGAVARRYVLSIQTDLFGWTIVERGWGRIGTRGQMKREAFERRTDAERSVKRLLARRATAHRRIGYAYRPVRSA